MYFHASTVSALTSLISSPSLFIVAGDTVTLTCSVTLPPGVTGTPDPQSERPGVTPTPSVPTTNAQELYSVVITDNTTASNPHSLSDNTAIIIGGAVAAIFIITIAIIVIAIIKLRSHGSIRKARE